MFEVSAASAVEGDGGANTEGQSRNEIGVELIEADPLPLVQLVGREANVLLVVSQVATVEEEEEFVSVAFVGCPVHGNKLPWLAVETEFFGEFTLAGRSRRLPTFDVAAGDVPGVFVGGVNQQNPVIGIEEQCAGGDSWCGEGAARVGHEREGMTRLLDQVQSAGKLVELGVAGAAVVA